eukprot:1574912-Ditylum_brightwellii.AAC.1
MMHPHRCYSSLGGRLSWFAKWCSCMNGVAGQDSLGNHISLPLSMPMGDTSEVVPTGYSDGTPFGVTVEDIFEVISVGDYIIIPHDRSRHITR